jgi:two-component system sensor histidine kinase BaeS
MVIPRLRSLRARLLLAMVAIAVAAVGATAWLTSRGTADRLRDDVEQTLEVDSYIYDQLLVYANSHVDWSQVEGLVGNLAAQTGRRIALTTPRGEVIVDSARLDGGGATPLPDRPAAVVDPLNPAISFIGFPPADGEIVDSSTDTMMSGPTYTLTPEETADRLAIAEEAADCLDDAGVANEVVVDEESGAVDIEVSDADEDDDVDDGEIDRAYEDCVDPAMYAPGAAEAAALAAEEDLIRACLDDHGVEYTVTEGDDLVPSTAMVDWDDPEATDIYDGCAAAAQRELFDPTMADPARLYLGTGERSALQMLDAGGGRTLAAASVVALLAVAVTVMVSRRLLRPVAALTTAAHRMAGGELAQRVDVRGADELAGLARSFNAMADAVATNEEQRRRLVNDVAHELRTPLANIRGYVEAALDGVTPSDDRLLASLHEEAVLLQRLVDDLQTLALAESRRLVLHPEPVDLGALADQVVAAHRAQAGASGIELVVEREGEEDVTVDADAARLRQALGNLVTNALRYSSPGDRVTLRVGTDGVAGGRGADGVEGVVGVDRADGGDGRGDAAVVEVIDTGIGIAPEDLSHVFDRFWRADSSRARHTGGSGLGLAICSQLVEAHGGRVTAASTPGEGSTFAIHLPRRPS